MSMKIVHTDKCPIPVSNYSQAVISNGIVFLAGMGPRQPVTSLIEGDIDAQIEQTFTNMRVTLEAAGTSLDKMIRCVCYVLTREHIPAVNRAFERHFPTQPPGRAILVVPDFGIEGMLFETVAEAALD